MAQYNGRTTEVLHKSSALVEPADPKYIDLPLYVASTQHEGQDS